MQTPPQPRERVVLQVFDAIIPLQLCLLMAPAKIRVKPQSELAAVDGPVWWRGSALYAAAYPKWTIKRLLARFASQRGSR